VADSWFSDSKLMTSVAHRHHGTVLVQGKTTYTVTLEDERKVKGTALIHDHEWPWRQSLHALGCRYARLRAQSPTYGAVVRDHRVTTRGRRRSWRCSARLSLLSHFPLELVSSLRYKTSISLTLLSAAWRCHGTAV